MLFCLVFTLEFLPTKVLQLHQAVIIILTKVHYFNTNTGVKRVIVHCLKNMISRCILLTHTLWPFSLFFFLLTDVFTPQMTSCSWRSMRASSRLPFRRSSLGEQPHFKRKWIILWNEWRHVPESQQNQNTLSFPPPFYLCTLCLPLLSFYVFRISLQLENSKRRKELLQDTVVAPPYVSCHDLVAWVEGFPVYSEHDVLKTKHIPFCYKEHLPFYLLFSPFCLCLHSVFTWSSSLSCALSQ